MQLVFASVFLVSFIIYASAQYQLDPSEYYVDTHFRSGSPSSSFDVAEADERFIKTISLTLSTTTITTTTTSMATCTTSTGGLSVCTASGRRRRGLHLSRNKEGRGLFYAENEGESEDGTIFLPSPIKEEVKQIQPEIVPTPEENKAAKAIPFVVEPGFSAPSRQSRVLVYFGTSTTTTTTTTTSTSTLTAVCRSTTGYPVCGSTGK
ncbi:uncharacterized protein LOC130691938 [Daphnia carinata]|uniref:uncharacterized protein LOC130691938 n=1 Tax=Daphnia carinata TaxID=120202 RepID=UPI00257C7D67|nr:uncharacterized protein LOC130691938 [Daphnia carinata]